VIYLLDLYATLCENTRDVGLPWRPNIAVERYRQWLVDLIRQDHVILITWRHQSFGRASLERIASELGGWQPHEHWFRDRECGAPEWKHHVMQTHVMPRFGRDARLYFALESNVMTRGMYEALGIPAVSAGSGPWKEIPKIAMPVPDPNGWTPREAKPGRWSGPAKRPTGGWSRVIRECGSPESLLALEKELWRITPWPYRQNVVRLAAIRLGELLGDWDAAVQWALVLNLDTARLGDVRARGPGSDGTPDLAPTAHRTLFG